MTDRMNYAGLVGMFVAFMKALGCFRDEDGAIGNYLTIHKGADPGKPCWLKGKHSKYRDDWPAMCRACWEAGINLAYHHGKGWFIGTEEDLAATLEGMEKGNITRIKNFVEHVGHVNMVSDGSRKDRILKAYNAKRKTPATFDDIENILQTTLKTLGASIKRDAIPLLAEFIIAQDDTDG